MRPTPTVVFLPISPLWFSLYLLALFVGGSWAQNIAVTAPDSRLSYVGTWVDQDNGGHRFTGEKGASVSLTFQGTAVYWYSNIDPRGAIGQVTVDGGNSAVVDLSAQATEDQDKTVSALMFSKEGLDGTQQHTIKIAYVGPGKLGGPYLSFYRFEFTPPSTSGAVTTTSPSQTVTTATTIVTQTQPTTTTDANGQGQTTTIIKTSASTTTTFTSTDPVVSTPAASVSTSNAAPFSTSIATDLVRTVTSATSALTEKTIVSQVPSVFSTNGQLRTTTLFATYVSTPVASEIFSSGSESATAASATSILSSAGNAKKNALIGGIVGGVLGGVLAAVLLGFFVICLRRRRRTRRRWKAITNERTSRPFFLPPAASESALPLETDDKYELSWTTTTASTGPSSLSSTPPPREGSSTPISALPLLQYPQQQRAQTARMLSTVLERSSMVAQSGTFPVNPSSTFATPVAPNSASALSLAGITGLSRETRPLSYEVPPPMYTERQT